MTNHELRVYMFNTRKLRYLSISASNAQHGIASSSRSL